MVVVTEQGGRPLTPSLAPEQLSNRDSRGNRSTSEVEDGVEGRPKRRVRSPADLQLSADTGSEHLESKKKPASRRLKPAAPFPPMPSQSDFEIKFERKKSQPTQLSKTNGHYHKLFKEISKDELLKQSYTCAVQKDILYQGKMFVSDNWICFHSKVFGKDTKISIPVLSVTFIKKTKTALLVPNALVIETATEQHVFVSFLSRNTAYKFLKSICIHLEVDKMCSSPITSPSESSFGLSCSSSLPLDFAGDFSDLDGVVQQRRQEMMESSSSSGSQTPDYEKLSDFTRLPDTFLSAVKSGEVSVHADIHLQTPSQKHRAALKNALIKNKLQRNLEKLEATESVGRATDQRPLVAHSENKILLLGSTKPNASGKSSQLKSLHAILLIYLFLVGVLVLSSCYMAFKIVSLEERLNSLVSMGGHIRNKNAGIARSQDEVNAEIYGELSTNLFKLEKIQRNLRKLLEET